MQYVTVDAALPAVSRLSLGSWHTFVRLSFDKNLGVLRAALDHGVNTFDVGCYADQPGTEETFSRAMRTLGVARSAYVLASKPAFALYPAQSMAELLKASLLRLGVDEVDLIMVLPPASGVDFTAYCEEMAALVAAGLTRAWGATNWTSEQLSRAHSLLRAKRAAAPCITQQKYNIARREIESHAFANVFQKTQTSLCASQVLEGGLLAGQLERGGLHAGAHVPAIGDRDRILPRDAGNIRARMRGMYTEIERIAADFGVTPAQAAIAFVLNNPAVSTALIGVSTVSALKQNVSALDFPYGDDLCRALRAFSVQPDG